MEAPATGSERVPTTSEAIGARLAEIEAAVGAGGADLGALGFWRIVGRVKRDPALVAAHADRVGRIDAAAFRAWVGRKRIPAWLGTSILTAGTVAGLAAAVAATAIDDELWSGLLLLGAGGAWSVTLHSPTHHVVGALAGIRFTDYFVGGPPPPRPGIKTDYATYLRADASARAWMHASGAIATKLAPFIALAFVPAADAPWWSGAGLVALGAIQIATDVLFSVRTSDWKKFRRERVIARKAAGTAPAA